MFIELAAGAFLLEEFIRHRVTDEKAKGPEPEIPRVDSGIAVPMLFGRCRIKSPVLVWHGPYDYIDDRLRMDLFFVLGLGFQFGHVENRIHNVWASEQRLTPVPANAITALTGVGDHEAAAVVQLNRGGLTTEGYVEFLDGNPLQQLVTFAGASKTYTGDVMMAAGVAALVAAGHSEPEAITRTADNIPGYRGVLSVGLLWLGGDTVGFDHGIGGGMAAYQFEASSYYQQVGDQPLGLYSVVGQDANPMTVVYEVLSATLGKLGLSTSLIDLENFKTAAYALWIDGHGYSRYFPERTTAAEIIYDVLRQVDGVLFQDPTSGLIKIKLIRPDYSPADLPELNKSNCSKLTNFAMSGRTNLINKIVLRFPNREASYTDDSATAQNMANAVGNDGQVAEETIEYRGCCDPNLAPRLAERELAARSRPILKCTALGDRSLRNLCPGDPVILRWSNPDVAGAVMRVTAVRRGTLEDGHVALDLVSDFHHVWRGSAPQLPTGTDPVIPIGPVLGFGP